MSQFELLFGLYGLVLGLGLAELAAGFSRAYDRHAVQPIGWLAPGMAALLICDLFTFWLVAWRFRDWSMDYPLALTGGAIGLTYYFAATQVFPREGSTDAPTDRAFANRRLVAGCLAAINFAVFGVASVWQLIEQGADPEAVVKVVFNLIYFAILAWVAFAKTARQAAAA